MVLYVGAACAPYVHGQVGRVGQVALTPEHAAFLVLGVRALPPTRISLLYDGAAYCLDVTIDGVQYELGEYVTASEAGAVMVAWLRGRRLTTALGSGNRLAEAQRMGRCYVSFEVERSVEPATHDVVEDAHDDDEHEQ